MFLGSKVRPESRADNFTTICEPISRQCEILNISQPYRPPRPVTRITLLKWRSKLKADSLTAICVSFDVSQPYGPPWPVTGISL
jgi:hypothetical protein